jgi:phospholipid/cholesterol/gamma-HCH transport system substrate-binding protein
MKMFRERDPLPLGAIVLVWLVATIAVVLNINGVVGAFGRHYTAELAEAAGLKQGDPVRVSGLKVGRVSSVKLGGEGVLVEFSITNEDITLGSETTAAVSVATVLGDKALTLASAGSGRLEGSIPVSRTTTPYDVTEALSELTQETGQIDVAQVAKALETVSATVDRATPELRAAMDGIGRLSKTVASRDAQLRSLLSHAEGVSGVLADRSRDLTALVRDGNLLFAELVSRREDIETLLVNVTSMARQLSALVDENRTEVGPMLEKLQKVIHVLRENKKNLGATLDGVAGYATGLGEVVASGPFFTAYLQNLLPGNFFPPKVTP